MAVTKVEEFDSVSIQNASVQFLRMGNNNQEQNLVV